MLRSIFTKTLRDYRIPILAWGLGLALTLYSTITLYASQFTSPREIIALATSLRFIAEPIEVATPTGFATWRLIGTLPLLLGVWAALAGARLTRGQEERGTLDLVLATPRSRSRFLGESLGALGVALALIGLLIALGALRGESVAGVPVAIGGALLIGLNLALLTLVFALLALLLSQFFTSAGAAAGAASALLVLSWVLDGAGRVAPALAPLARLSPFHLYNLSKPLIASQGANPAAMLALAALAATLGGASAALFARRDLGGSAWPWQGRAAHADPARALAAARHDPSLRGIGPRAFRAAAPALAWWLLGLASFILLILGVTRATKDQIRDLLAGAPALSQLFGDLGGGTDAGFLSGFLALFLPLLVTAYALTQATAWARDLDAGRLEMLLGTPLPRWRVYLEACAATLATLVVAPLILWLVALGGLRVWGLQVAGDRLLDAFVGLLPLELVVAGLAYLAAGRLSAGGTSGLIGGLLAFSFLLDFLAPLLKLPAWATALSLFHHYGQPLIAAPRWGTWLALAALGIALALGGGAQFARSDLRRGA